MSDNHEHMDALFHLMLENDEFYNLLYNSLAETQVDLTPQEKGILNTNRWELYE